MTQFLYYRHYIEEAALCQSKHVNKEKNNVSETSEKKQNNPAIALTL